MPFLLQFGSAFLLQEAHTHVRQCAPRHGCIAAVVHVGFFMTGSAPHTKFANLNATHAAIPAAVQVGCLVVMTHAAADCLVQSSLPLQLFLCLTVFLCLSDPCVQFSFYMVVFHCLSNLPLDKPLYFGVHMRFWMQVCTHTRARAHGHTQTNLQS